MGSSALTRVACTVDVLYAIAGGLFVLIFVFPWEASAQATPRFLAIFWSYAFLNMGAMLVKSRPWRIAWSIPAGLANVVYLIFAIWVLLDLPDAAAGIVGGLALLLVILNTSAIALGFRLPPATSGQTASNPEPQAATGWGGRG